MGSGFTEIGLVIFTTMAPAGAVAYVLVALVALLGHRERQKSARVSHIRTLSHFLIIPLGVAVVGLIASATQLGTPANALNAFNGLGRSPLSNEVTCSVIFLALAGIYWLASFYNRIPHALMMVWLSINCLAAVVMVFGISQAYRVDTIPTWDSIYVPVNLWCVGLYGGPVLALATLLMAGEKVRNGYRRALVTLSAVALVGETTSCLLQNAALATYRNGIISGSALVPAYPVMIFTFLVLGTVGLIGVSRTEETPTLGRTVLVWVFTSLAFVAIFFVRFAFYGLHMTIGM